jgi:hypothetical protein
MPLQPQPEQGGPKKERSMNDVVFNLSDFARRQNEKDDAQLRATSDQDPKSPHNHERYRQSQAALLALEENRLTDPTIDQFMQQRLGEFYTELQRTHASLGNLRQDQAAYQRALPVYQQQAKYYEGLRANFAEFRKRRPQQFQTPPVPAVGQRPAETAPPAVATTEQIVLSSEQGVLGELKIPGGKIVDGEPNGVRYEVSDIVVQACAKRNKTDLGTNLKMSPNGLSAEGGQDACGARVYPRGSILMALAIGADGCSFASDAHLAARAAVTAGLRSSGEIIGKKTTNGAERDQTLDTVGNLILSMQSEVKKLGNEQVAAATVVCTGIGVDMQPGRPPQLYDYYSNAGDEQQLVFWRSAGQWHVHKIVNEDDMINQKLRGAGHNLDNLGLDKVRELRQGVIDQYKQIAYSSGVAKSDAEATRFAENALQIGSGVANFLGANKVHAFGTRINLTQEYFDRGAGEIIVMTCSDNAGEKMPEQTLLGAITQGRNNTERAKILNDLMVQWDEDDGSLVMMTAKKIS